MKYYYQLSNNTTMYTQRTNEAIILESIKSQYITAILGPRRVGKTTFVSEFVANHPEFKWYFINLDELELRLKVVASGLKKMIQEGIKRELKTNEVVYVYIDEAQKCPEIFDQIKLLYDEYKDQNAIKIIITGSGFLSLHRLAAESLAGRVELFYLREFGLREGCLLTEQLEFPPHSIFDFIYPKFNVDIEKYINSLAPLRQVILAEIQRQIIWGGLPELILTRETKDKEKYLANYLQTYLEKDVRAIATISDLELYRHLMMILAEQTGSTRNDDKITSSLGCSRDTLKKYRGYLLATLMYKEVYPFIGSPLKRVVKSPKGYIFSNALVSYLTGIYAYNVLEKSGLIGHRLENLVLKELQIFLDREFKQTGIYFWRTSGGMEVDFVAEITPSIFPFEITYSTKIQNNKVKNLLNFLATEPRAKIGYYLYFGDYRFDSNLNICFLPLWALG